MNRKKTPRLHRHTYARHVSQDCQKEILDQLSTTDRLEEYLKRHDVNTKVSGHVLLNVFAEAGRLDLIKVAVSHGADVHRDTEAALRCAVAASHFDIAQYFIEEHDANFQVDNGSIFIGAALHNEIDFIDFLLKLGDSQSFCLNDALLQVVYGSLLEAGQLNRSDILDTVQYLVEHGADPIAALDSEILQFLPSDPNTKLIQYLQEVACFSRAFHEANLSLDTDLALHSMLMKFASTKSPRRNFIISALRSGLITDTADFKRLTDLTDNSSLNVHTRPRLV